MYTHHAYECSCSQRVIPAEEGGHERTLIANWQNRFNGSNSVFWNTYCQYFCGVSIPFMLFLNADGGKTDESWISKAAKIPGKDSSILSTKSEALCFMSTGNWHPSFVIIIFARIWKGVIALYILRFTANFNSSERAGLEDNISHVFVASPRFDESDCMTLRLWVTMSSWDSICTAPSLIWRLSRIFFIFSGKMLGSSSLTFR